MTGLFTWITTRPVITIALCLAFTAPFAAGLTRLVADANVENMLPEGHPAVLAKERIEEVFGAEDAITIAVVREDGGSIYDAGTLARVKTIGDRLAEVRGVDPAKVYSVFSAENIVADEGGFAVAPLAEAVPANDEQMNALREAVRGNPFFYGSLVSRNGAGTLVFGALTPAANKAQVYFDVRDLLDALPPGPETFYVTGQPVIEGVIGIHVERDMAKMMPLVSLVIILTLTAIFRSVRGVVLPLAVVLLSVVCAMGLMAWCGIPIYPMTTIVPIVIMAIGVADGIHIVTRFDEGARRHPNDFSRDIARRTMLELGSPVVMTSLTTAVGFLSLLTSDMRPIFHTGVFTAFGVMAAMVFSLTLIPAALSLREKPAVRYAITWWANADKMFDRVGVTVFRRRAVVLAAGTVVVLASAALVSRLNVDSDPMANFNQEDPIPISTDVINRLFSGAMTVHVTLASGTEKRFLEPDVLRAIDAFQRELEADPIVGATASVVDLLKMMHMAMSGGGEENRVVPPTRNLAGTYLMLYTGDNLDKSINYARDETAISVRLMTTSTKTVGRAVARIRELMEKHFGAFSDVTPQVGGMGVVLVELTDILVFGQVWSILLSIAGVFAITAIMFRSLVAGVFNIVPISIATLVNFGVMGLFGIPLEPATAITSCIGIGVGVDYAIHFIAKYRFMRRTSGDIASVVETTMGTAGKAIFFNAAVVIGGFLVLLASEFPPSRHMGVMISLNMFTSFAAAVTILAVLLAVFDPRFVRAGGAPIEAQANPAGEVS
ncbi:MMPL family transporter [bacterium]|nr:MMPL family transporter [bacterium]